ncbi:MAG: small multi-drug export protein, partial [Elusimicrobia bacterium]|nr:small multi-drug export protein [Elusimicrobiota bacterium]
MTSNLLKDVNTELKKIIEPIIGKFFKWCLEKGEKAGKKLEEKTGKSIYVAILLFVGIPLPGTGAWT